MDFTNTFTVKVHIDRVWEYMLDAEKVTPCVPGAQLTETIDSTHYKGTIKVKLGAVQMSYRGELEMEPDEASHTILLRAKGTETRGSGGVSGVVTTRLTADENGATTVVMESHVDVTGRVAQFGRGIMQDVANRLVKEFARCLEEHVTVGSVEETAPASSGVESTPPQAPTDSAESDALPAGGETVAASSSAATAESPQPRVAPTQAPRSMSPSPAPATEIRLIDLVLDITRARLAALLRYLADRIEPKA